MQEVMNGFKSWCGLLCVQGTINGMHISISKLFGSFCENYFYHKTIGYNILVETICDHRKTFIDIYVGLLGLVNDSHVLHKYGFYAQAQYHNLFYPNIMDYKKDTPPYVLRDKGYFLLSWLMTPNKEGNRNLLKPLYNRKHKQRKSLIKKQFQYFEVYFSLYSKETEMDVAIIPNFMAC